MRRLGELVHGRGDGRPGGCLSGGIIADPLGLRAPVAGEQPGRRHDEQSVGAEGGKSVDDVVFASQMGHLVGQDGLELIGGEQVGGSTGDHYHGAQHADRGHQWAGAVDHGHVGSLRQRTPQSRADDLRLRHPEHEARQREAEHHGTYATDDGGDETRVRRCAEPTRAQVGAVGEQVGGGVGITKHAVQARDGGGNSACDGDAKGAQPSRRAGRGPARRQRLDDGHCGEVGKGAQGRRYAGKHHYCGERDGHAAIPGPGASRRSTAPASPACWGRHCPGPRRSKTLRARRRWIADHR